MAARPIPRPQVRGLVTGVSRVPPSVQQAGQTQAQAVQATQAQFSGESLTTPPGVNPIYSNLQRQVQTPQGALTVNFGIVGSSILPVSIARNVTFTQLINQTSGPLTITGNQTYTYGVQGGKIVGVQTGESGQVAYNGTQIAKLGNNNQISILPGATINQPEYGIVSGKNQYLGSVVEQPTFQNGQFNFTPIGFQSANVVISGVTNTNPVTGLPSTKGIGYSFTGQTTYNISTGQIGITPNASSTLNLSFLPKVTNGISINAQTSAPAKAVIGSSTGLGFTSLAGLSSLIAAENVNFAPPPPPNQTINRHSLFSRGKGHPNRTVSVFGASNSTFFPTPQGQSAIQVALFNNGVLAGPSTPLSVLTSSYSGTSVPAKTLSPNTQSTSEFLTGPTSLNFPYGNTGSSSVIKPASGTFTISSNNVPEYSEDILLISQGATQSQIFQVNRALDLSATIQGIASPIITIGSIVPLPLFGSVTAGAEFEIQQSNILYTNATLGTKAGSLALALTPSVAAFAEGYSIVRFIVPSGEKYLSSRGIILGITAGQSAITHTPFTSNLATNLAFFGAFEAAAPIFKPFAVAGGSITKYIVSSSENAGFGNLVGKITGSGVKLIPQSLFGAGSTIVYTGLSSVVGGGSFGPGQYAQAAVIGGFVPVVFEGFGGVAGKTGEQIFGKPVTQPLTVTNIDLESFVEPFQKGYNIEPTEVTLFKPITPNLKLSLFNAQEVSYVPGAPKSAVTAGNNVFQVGFTTEGVPQYAFNPLAKNYNVNSAYQDILAVISGRNGNPFYFALRNSENTGLFETQLKGQETSFNTRGTATGVTQFGKPFTATLQGIRPGIATPEGLIGPEGVLTGKATVTLTSGFREFLNSKFAVALPTKTFDIYTKTPASITTSVTGLSSTGAFGKQSVSIALKQLGPYSFVQEGSGAFGTQEVLLEGRGEPEPGSRKVQSPFVLIKGRLTSGTDIINVNEVLASASGPYRYGVGEAPSGSEYLPEGPGNDLQVTMLAKVISTKTVTSFRTVTTYLPEQQVPLLSGKFVTLPTTKLIPSLRTVPFVSIVPVTTFVQSSRQVPITKQIPTTKLIPTTKSVPTTNIIPTTKNVPITKNIPVTKSVPILKSIPITKNVPITKNIPITKSIPIVKTVPVTKTIPVTKTVPVTKSVPITKSIPITKSLPIGQTIDIGFGLPFNTTIPFGQRKPTVPKKLISPTISLNGNFRYVSDLTNKTYEGYLPTYGKKQLTKFGNVGYFRPLPKQRGRKR